VTERVAADTDDLDQFVQSGVGYVAALRGMADEVRSRRSTASVLLGISIPSAQPALDELADLASATNQFVVSVHEALLAYGRIVAAIDKGDDYNMSNGELNRVNDELKDLDVRHRQLVFDSLTDDQLDVVFHNVHSSGFWSNDWDDRERTEFYAILDPLSTKSKERAGQFSPYLEALAEAEQAADGDWAATSALHALRTGDGFTDDLDFDERTALLWQSAHYPDARSIANLERLADQDWFVRFDLGDTQRSAKMIAFLSQHPGDRTVIDNTLDAFLADDAPFRFDWNKQGRAYGSAGGDEFHFNRAYLDAGNDPVVASVPSTTTYERTEHMVTHTVAHEVNHLINEDSVADTYQYFMAEYRAYYVGQLARNGTPPTRGEVERRVSSFFNAKPGDSYDDIADAARDPVQGPLIAAFAEDILGRPVDHEDLDTEFSIGVTDPDVLAPPPISVAGEANNVENSI
jgi:hypothetical protein